MSSTASQPFARGAFAPLAVRLVIGVEGDWPLIIAFVTLQRHWKAGLTAGCLQWLTIDRRSPRERATR